VERARNFAQRLNNSALAVIDKRRSGPNQIGEMKVVGDVQGQTCILVDDMVDTGGTLIKASDTLLAAGAKRVIACCTHPVLSGESLERIEKSSLESLVVTDTIPAPKAARSNKIKILSVSSLFAEAISRIHGEDSISSLFG
jgi:ribose-phosphate pyrophosphokinase